MDRQIIFESMGGAGGKTCGIVNKVLVIELSWAKPPTGNKDKVWFGLKELGSTRICLCMHAYMCTCVSL